MRTMRILAVGLTALQIGWCALWAQFGIVNEIRVPGDGKAKVAGFLPPLTYPSNYFDAFIIYVYVPPSGGERQKVLLRARFTLQGELVDAEWIEGETGAGNDDWRNWGCVEYLDDERIMLAMNGYPGWLAVYDRHNSSRSWRVKMTLEGLHTATVGKSVITDPDRVIAALSWRGYWTISIFNPDTGGLIRSFRFSGQNFPTLGTGQEYFLTTCCTISKNILAYDGESGNFLLVTGAEFSRLRGRYHLMVYAFSAEGDVRWVSAIAAGNEDTVVSGSTLGILPLGDGTAVIYSSYYGNLKLLRIDTRTGQLLEAISLDMGPLMTPHKLQLVSTVNYGTLVGYVGGSFGGVRDSDWGGWLGRVPNAVLYEMLSLRSPAGQVLWALGGTKISDDDPAGVLAIVEPDEWVMSPFIFYPCFEAAQPPTTVPLQPILAERGTVSTQPAAASPIQSASFSVRPASIEVRLACEVSTCRPSNGDVNGDGCVDDADLLAVLFAFGQTGDRLPEDVNCDGVVDDADLLTVLFNFGTGC